MMNPFELKALEDQVLREIKWADRWNMVKLMFGALVLATAFYATTELVASIGPMMADWFQYPP